MASWHFNAKNGAQLIWSFIKHFELNLFEYLLCALLFITKLIPKLLLSCALTKFLQPVSFVVIIISPCACILKGLIIYFNIIYLLTLGIRIGIFGEQIARAMTKILICVLRSSKTFLKSVLIWLQEKYMSRNWT